MADFTCHALVASPVTLEGGAGLVAAVKVVDREVADVAVPTSLLRSGLRRSTPSCTSAASLK